MARQIHIVLVNWNTGLMALQALKPYIGYSSSKIRCQVIVVDNASTDDSLALLTNKVPVLIINTSNLGFGKACNEALSQCHGDYVLLLNADTESSPHVLEELVDFLEDNYDFAVTGPQQRTRQGEVLRTCARFPSFSTSCYEVLGLSKLFPRVFMPAPIMTDWDHLQSREVDQVMGSYMLIRRSVLDVTGFMDEDYFVYAEDRDLSKRISEAGFKSYFNARCSILHDREDAGKDISAQKLFYSIDARRIYWKKHLGRLSYVTLVFLSLLAEPPLRIIDSLLSKRSLRIGTVTKAYVAYIKKIFKDG